MAYVFCGARIIQAYGRIKVGNTYYNNPAARSIQEIIKRKRAKE